MSLRVSTGEPLLTATALLGQQLWCWGRDIEHPGGNLLVRHGFERIEPRVERRCSSVYRLPLPMGSRVILRGFGVFYGEDGMGGIFVSRDEFNPIFTPDGDLVDPPWRSEDLPPFHPPGGAEEVRAWLHLSCTLLRWIRLYESWIEKTMGADYRAETIAVWEASDRPVVPADRVRDALLELESRLKERAADPERFGSRSSGRT